MVEYRERLKWAMEQGPRAPVTVRALSTRLGMSYQAVRKVLIGESHAFSAANHENAAAFLGVSGHWLTSGRGPRLADTTSAPLTAQEPAPASLVNKPLHPDAWIAEAIRTLEAMAPEDRRAAVLNLRVFCTTLGTPGIGQALPVAA